MVSTLKTMKEQLDEIYGGDGAKPEAGAGDSAESKADSGPGERGPDQ